MSGLLCATLNFMEKANSLSPLLSLRPTGAFHAKEKLNNNHVKYATLPREIVCTGKYFSKSFAYFNCLILKDITFYQIRSQDITS